MNTLYTAVGRFKARSDKRGRRYPVIVVSNKEFHVDYHEMIIWTCLSWRLLRLHELEEMYYHRALDLNLIVTDCRNCVASLKQKGLVVTGTGRTDADAMYNLVSDLFILPATENLIKKTACFLKSIFQMKIPFREAGEVFRQEQLTDFERLVLSLARQTLLSTAEIIKCADNGITRLPNEIAVIDALYTDEVTSCHTISRLVQQSENQRPVLIAVGNLYVRKQILFERVIN